ncbi:hypothetical protein BDZ94DRAFT_1308497 [Collybia nuda]|uniref:G domain-containing protein n=1 Tax=Collybia nuda TaxID=64659 RepID=A0A9P5Y5Q3_9AGAR|nr:hypothetical protein BDZ94DRAFT_1308497 [Collybia nuda]
MAASLFAPSAADTPNAKIPFPSSSLRLHLKEDYESTETEQIAERSRVCIAVFGASGSGKSSFINTVTGSHLKINHELEPYEHPVELGNEFELDGRLITLIDTPGLDMNNGINVNIVRGVCAALDAPMGVKLDGVIFLHSIFAELPWFSERLFSLSKNLCLEKDLKKLVVVKTTWAEPGVSLEQIKTREMQVDSFFKLAQIQGAKLVRCEMELESKDTILESAHQLIRYLLEPGGDNQLADEEDVSGTESTIPPTKMKFSKASSSRKKGHRSRYHKNAPRHDFLFAQKQRTRDYASETARRRRNRDSTNIRGGIQKFFGERRDILARMGKLRARLRWMAT